MVTCPLCDSAIDVDEEELDEGDTITCEECGGELRVVGVHPELDLEPVEDEDEDEDEELDREEDEEDEHWRQNRPDTSV